MIVSVVETNKITELLYMDDGFKLTDLIIIMQKRS